MRCLGRISKDEKLTFGDGKMPFLIEDRCRSILQEGPPICEKCTRNPINGLINQLIPETSLIFGPTNSFLAALKKHGNPIKAKEVFKKAVEAHNRVVESMSLEQKKAKAAILIKPLKFVEINDSIEITEVREVLLKVKITAKKQILKDDINNINFEKDTTTGQLTRLQ